MKSQCFRRKCLFLPVFIVQFFRVLGTRRETSYDRRNCCGDFENRHGGGDTNSVAQESVATSSMSEY